MSLRAAIFSSILFAAGSAAQVIDAPCVPRFRADPSYIQVSEASGGQMLLLDRKEIASPVVTRAQLGFHDQTFLRASGTLGSGFVELTSPIDSTIRTLQLTVFAECVKSIAITAPSGAAVEGERFASGRILFVDAPEPGVWRVKLAGTGYYTAIAQGKSEIGLAVSSVEPLTARVDGPVAKVEFRILSRSGAPLGPIEGTQDGSLFRSSSASPREPYRIAIEGVDEQGKAFRRVHAPLLQPKP